MTDHEQQRRCEQFLQGSRDMQEMWEREIACPDGPLPGAVLDVLEPGDGWLGHVQLVTGRPASDIDKAWDLCPGRWWSTPAAAAQNSGSTTIHPPPATTGSSHWASAIMDSGEPTACSRRRPVGRVEWKVAVSAL